MDQTAFQEDLEDLETDCDTHLPPALTTLIEKLKREGIYHEPTPSPEQKSPWLDAEAIEAMHEAIRHATALMGREMSLAEAAHHLEKIQIAAAMSERAAYITHTRRARRCSEVAHQIARQCRSYFHDLKAQARFCFASSKTTFPAPR